MSLAEVLQRSRYGQMQIYSQEYLLPTRCVQSQSADHSSALDLGMTSRGTGVPRTVALHSGLVQTKEKLFRSTFTPWI